MQRIRTQLHAGGHPIQGGDHGPTLLIVEDDPDLTAALRQLLQLEGFACITSPTGTDAIACLSQLRVDVVLVDIHLPDMSGLLLAQWVRDHLARPVPVLVMSGDTSSDVIRRLYAAGATYFFSKPLRPGVLIAWLREWFSTSRSEA